MNQTDSETGISSGLMGHLARMQTLPTYLTWLASDYDLKFQHFLLEKCNTLASFMAAMFPKRLLSNL